MRNTSSISSSSSSSGSSIISTPPELRRSPQKASHRSPQVLKEQHVKKRKRNKEEITSPLSNDRTPLENSSELHDEDLPAREYLTQSFSNNSASSSSSTPSLELPPKEEHSR